MEINPISAGAYGMQYGSAPGGDAEIDQSEFMQLLITQMQHQDPFEPMDNTQMVSQLNQFSMLDEISTLNSKTDDMLLMSQSLNNTMMLDLVGRTVKVEGDQVQIDPVQSLDADGETITGIPTVSDFTFTTASGGTATVTLKDSTGVQVGSFTVPVVAGTNELDWQTLLNDPDYADLEGRYTVDVDVTSSNGVAVDARTFMTLPVDSIRYENNVGIVGVGDSEFFVSEIYEVGT